MYSLVLALALPIQAQDLDSMLSRGEVVLVESDAQGRVHTVTAMCTVPAPPPEVWALLTGWTQYASWMPKVGEAEVMAAREGEVDVRWELDVPGPDVKYTATFALDPSTWSIQAHQIDGDLAGSTWSWRLEPVPGGTRVTRVSRSTAVADVGIVQQLDDEWHTIELGIYAATPVVELRGVQQALSR